MGRLLTGGDPAPLPHTNTHEDRIRPELVNHG